MIGSPKSGMCHGQIATARIYSDKKLLRLQDMYKKMCRSKHIQNELMTYSVGVERIVVSVCSWPRAATCVWPNDRSCWCNRSTDTLCTECCEHPHLRHALVHTVSQKFESVACHFLHSDIHGWYNKWNNIAPATSIPRTWIHALLTHTYIANSTSIHTHSLVLLADDNAPAAPYSSAA